MGHAAQLRQERNQRASQDRADPRHGGEQPGAVNERGIGRDDLDQVPIEQVDIGGEPSDAAAGKTLQHRIFQQSRGIFSGDFRVAELAAHGEDLGQPFDRRRVGCAGRVGMMAIYYAIMRASRGSFFASMPLARAN